MNKNALLIGALSLGVFSMFSFWRIPASGRKYAELFEQSEKKYKLPKNLLARVAYQESHFRHDIISGKLPSKAGALGIMQIIPRWHPNVDPLNPKAAIPYAASYLAKLHKRFGNWKDALAAYNWGPTNLSKYYKGEKKIMPLETKNYVAQISRDVTGV